MNRILAALGLITVLAFALSGSAYADPAENGPGLASLAGCASKHQNLDVLVLMDESGSLSEPPNPTDPQDQRVVALQRLLEGLAQAPTDGPSINVELDGFADTFSVVKPFAPLTTAMLPEFARAAQSFTDRDKGAATDFGIAIENARQRLVHQASSREGTSCQVIVLFTDGQYDANGAVGDEAGRAALCYENGPVDQLRGDNVALVAVGLGSAPASLLKLMVGVGACGMKTPNAGLYLPAEDVEALITSFGLIGEVFKGGTYADPDPSDPRPFYLGADLTSVQIFAQMSDAAAYPVLESPSGASISADNARREQVLDGMQWKAIRSDPQVVRLSGTPMFTGSDWAGEWSIRTSGGARTSDNVFDIVRFPDLRPKIDGDPALQLGETSTITVTLHRLNGESPTAAQLAQPHELDVAIVDPTNPASATEVTPVETQDGYSFDYTPDVSSGASSVDVVLTLNSLAPDGRPLTTVTATTALTVQPPSSFPEVDTTSIDLGVIRDDEPVERGLTVTGGAEAGCVAIRGVSTSRLPDGVNSLDSSADASCVSVAAGEQLSIPVSFEHSGSGYGHLRGDLEVELRDSSNQTIEFRIPIRGIFDPPIDEPRRLLLFVALLLGGTLIPLLIMHLVARFGGRLAPRDSVRFVNVPIVVSPTDVSSTKTLSSPTLISELLPIPDDELSATRIAVPDGPVIKRRLPLNPFAEAIATTEPSSMDIVGSAGTSQDSGERFVGHIPTRLGASWLFSTPPDSTPDAGDQALSGVLTLLVSDTPTSADPLGEAIESAIRRLPGLAAPLFAARQRARSSDDDHGDDGRDGVGTDASTSTRSGDDPWDHDPFGPQ